jgi:hypothetical protein
VLCGAVGRAVRARPHRRCSARQWSCSSSTAAKATTSTLGGPLSPDMAAKLAALKTSDKGGVSQQIFYLFNSLP